MPMSIRILPCNHLLLVENGLQEFDDAGSVLAIIDDHARAADQPEPRLVAIALPKDDGLLRELERWAPRIREHSLSDAYEAMSAVLLAAGIPEVTVDKLLEDTRALAEQEKVPAGWTAWSAIPPGSLSAFGDGQYLLRWPAGHGRLDSARFELSDKVRGEPGPEDRVVGPEFTFNPGRPSVPWVKIVRTGLTAEQMAAFLAAPVVDGEAADAAIARIFPLTEAA